MQNDNTHCIGLLPSVDKNSRVLILGSMPGAASLAAQQYYAHPSNRFWPLITKLLQEKETPHEYPDRLKMLLRHHVALWDAIDTCDRPGSLDSDIRNVRANDFTAFLKQWPNIHVIGLNGGKAYATFEKANRPLFDRTDLRILKLPSTSPANARWRMEDLIQAWKDLFHGDDKFV